LLYSPDNKGKKSVEHQYTDFAMLDEDILLCMIPNKSDKSNIKKRLRDEKDEKHEANMRSTIKKQKRLENASLLAQTTKEQDNLTKIVTTYGRGLKYNNSVHKTFPHVLMEILYQENLNEIIAWKPHGRAFIVNDRKKFVEKVLRNFFEMTSFASFIRQLNIWGFTRMTKGKDAGAYYHELFLRGRSHLIRFMHRQERNWHEASL